MTSIPMSVHDESDVTMTEVPSQRKTSLTRTAGIQLILRLLPRFATCGLEQSSSPYKICKFIWQYISGYTLSQPSINE